MDNGIWQQWLDTDISHRRSADLSRTVRVVDRQGQWAVTDDGRRLLNFVSNDYLGLSCDPKVTAAAAQATRDGSGATSARLMAGTNRAYCTLEEKLAQFHRTDGALIFGSGYLANLGVINSLVSKDDAVFSDHLNHASIVDGCLLSGAKHYRYRHLDTDQLEFMLRDADSRGLKRKLIVTESVFSMDGDVAPLEQIADLRDRFNAALIVDEAHALGVFGTGGRGYAEKLGIANRVDLVIGTFGKALGGYGAYVAAGRAWIEYLTNAARTFVFSTALPPPVIAAVETALELVLSADKSRANIQARADTLREELRSMDLNVMQSETQIVPAVFGTSAKSLAISQELEQEGIWVRAIRPPTVPHNSSRLRFSITALFTDDDIARTTDAIRRCIAADSGRWFH